MLRVLRRLIGDGESMRCLCRSGSLSLLDSLARLEDPSPFAILRGERDRFRAGSL